MNNWIIEQMKLREWSQRELGRRSNYSHSMISDVLSGNKSASFDFCAAIAKAFGEQPEDVFRLAGLLPSLPGTHNEEITLKKLWDIITNMSVEERQEVLDYARYRFQREQEARRRQGREPGPAESGA